ncbi:sugar ABC transporter permease [Conexibacter sp. CPCC 206217]|uniref:sugar ABC transporter permease n=1 Tax=Conexibacter sp. CPCC 206217 TaxID=3064574 RepID=UPI00271907DD|nr:sugar ABC transporter permease [Conexibacter sp. CPCC 206217]MDO8209883.1 sugar ABC transporter permease [Conexibacter sp. CPCC 206217]
MSVTATPDTAPPPSGPDAADPTARHRSFFARFAQGELGSIQVLLALVVIWAVFTIANDRFLTATNLVNLALQIAGIGLISVGIVLVLLLGEIDLSVGIVSGLCSAIMAVLNVQHGWNPYLAIIAGIVAGAAIGIFQGTVVTAFGIPSFVVTLAGLIGWQGVQLWVLGETGTVNITDPVITGLAGTFYSGATAWILGAIVVGLFALACINARRRRVKAGVPAASPALVAARVIGLAVIVFVVIYVLTQDRGVPLAILILVGACVLFDYIVRRTRFGRYVLALGGNEEAARRAGIRVRQIRVAVFMIAGIMAAAGGIVLASRLLAVNQGSGGSDLLLLAIAGPVIAGTSLFGGRGTVWSALLGALVIGSISNGMDLLAFQSSTKNMVTGAVLLAAVIADAIARQRRRAAGRL